jgi:hypothetical protein
MIKRKIKYYYWFIYWSILIKLENWGPKWKTKLKNGQ